MGVIHLQQSSFAILRSSEIMNNSAMTAKMHLKNLNFFLQIFSLLTLAVPLPISHAATIVDSLPGYPGNLPFRLQTGYVGVGEEEQVQLFYYFIESERDPKRDPVLLWLTGGPGCSALSGLVLETGPLNFVYSAISWQSEVPKFKLNPYSWTKVASIIFVDSPVGTGFSYATASEGYYSDDITASRHMYEFLSKQGYILGNPYTAKKEDGVGSKYKYAQRVSLLSDELYELFLPYTDMPGKLRYRNVFLVPTTMILFAQGTKIHWVRCSKTLMYTKNVLSSFDYHLNFTRESFHALIYSGDQDMVISYVGTMAWIRKLNLSTSDRWRPWFVKGQVAGYTTKYSNGHYHLTFATVKGAGHTAPEFKPRECLVMIAKWFRMHPL
ncbi:hypothetical protein Cgig2_016588 [Carnegiea gigantea]|uniref:Serine carboxypeptidase n=1 Tax=Carnegiea gigantea TaxID=171969 RepID=A0A9Q1QRM2_9CARY|nr:hypothetical protein Cgig2_016588 [Carnegiea gigantea]